MLVVIVTTQFESSAAVSLLSRTVNDGNTLGERQLNVSISGPSCTAVQYVTKMSKREKHAPRHVNVRPLFCIYDYRYYIVPVRPSSRQQTQWSYGL
jgi:hypothetical protein